jgi:hypothetical protein
MPYSKSPALLDLERSKRGERPDNSGVKGLVELHRQYLQSSSREQPMPATLIDDEEQRELENELDALILGQA